jgi:integrase
MAEFCILTTVRTRPIIEMEWREVDFTAETWDIPYHHEKNFEDHRVPLSNRAMEILRQQRPANARPDDLIWPSESTGRLRSSNTMLRVLRRLGYAAHEVTQHGFRKSFSNWRAELTDFNSDMQEIALSHAIPGVRGVYQTGKLLGRRATMMQAWSDYCDGGSSDVVQVGRAA